MILAEHVTYTIEVPEHVTSAFGWLIGAGLSAFFLFGLYKLLARLMDQEDNIRRGK